MQRRPFGRIGLHVSPIGLGGYPFGGVNRAANCAQLLRYTFPV
jgi:aryl-alcohol dehydrogenase-like predicted oxidoreductase